MDKEPRDEIVNAAFATVADALVNEYDVIDLLSTLLDASTKALNMDAGGIVLPGPDGELELIASTNEESSVAETIFASAAAGPCFDCYNTGNEVFVPDIDSNPEGWGKLQDCALAQGFHSAHALPMKFHGQIIGVLNLFGSKTVAISEPDAIVARALADLAVLCVISERSASGTPEVMRQLYAALDSRIFVDQAEGFVAQTERLTLTEAFRALRAHAHEHCLPLHHVAEATIQRAITITPGGHRPNG